VHVSAMTLYFICHLAKSGKKILKLPSFEEMVSHFVRAEVPHTPAPGLNCNLLYYEA